MTINSTTDDLIAEIEAAARAATPGPHHIYTHQRDDNNWKANAEFHARCQPQTVLALTARVRELEAREVSLTPMITAGDVYDSTGMDDEDCMACAQMVNGAISACGSMIKAAGIKVAT